MSMFHNMFPTLPPEHEPDAERIYRSIFGDLPLDAWQKQGTIITRFVNGRKLNFAARRHHCTLGFQGYGAVEFYTFIGGDCPTGGVTIKPWYDRPFDPELIADTIDWYFNN